MRTEDLAMQIKLEKRDGEWLAVIIKPKGVIFGGAGASVYEAVGHCIVSNREILDIQFDFEDHDAKKVRTLV